MSLNPSFFSYLEKLHLNRHARRDAPNAAAFPLAHQRDEANLFESIRINSTNPFGTIDSVAQDLVKMSMKSYKPIHYAPNLDAMRSCDLSAFSSVDSAWGSSSPACPTVKNVSIGYNGRVGTSKEHFVPNHAVPTEAFIMPLAAKSEDDRVLSVVHRQEDLDALLRSNDTVDSNVETFRNERALTAKMSEGEVKVAGSAELELDLQKPKNVTPKTQLSPATSSSEEKSSGKAEKSYITDVVHDRDVICGQGGQTNNHPGSQHFLDLVRRHRQKYQNPKSTKTKRLIVEFIIARIYKENRRFLRKDKTNRWYVPEQKWIWNKVGNALRETYDTPEKRKAKAHHYKSDEYLAAKKARSTTKNT